MRGPVPMIRIIVFGGLYCGAPSGKLPCAYPCGFSSKFVGWESRQNVLPVRKFSIRFGSNQI